MGIGTHGKVKAQENHVDSTVQGEMTQANKGTWCLNEMNNQEIFSKSVWVTVA